MDKEAVEPRREFLQQRATSGGSHQNDAIGSPVIVFGQEADGSEDREAEGGDEASYFGVGVVDPDAAEGGDEASEFGVGGVDPDAGVPECDPLEQGPSGSSQQGATVCPLVSFDKEEDVSDDEKMEVVNRGAGVHQQQAPSGGPELGTNLVSCGTSEDLPTSIANSEDWKRFLLAEKYSDEHIVKIVNLPRRSEPVFKQRSPDSIPLKLNEQLKSALHTSKNAEKTVRLMNMTKLEYRENTGKDFSSEKMAFSVGDLRGDTVLGITGGVRSPVWVSKIAGIWEKLAKFETSNQEFRYVLCNVLL